MSDHFHDEIINQVKDTDEFKRLASIKQLGISNKVFPSLNHSRRVHSEGVCKQAEWFLGVLEKNSGIKIDRFHKLCVKMAGLLHDIGHGPFSHFWEKVLNNGRNEQNFKHEEIGALIVDKVFSQVELSDDPLEHGYGVELIKCLIVGNKKKFAWRSGRKEEFIFDIINNKNCAIDVDRLDYLRRDWECCLGKIVIPGVNVEEHLENIDMLFQGARVSDDRKCIKFNAKHISYINSMFELREAFHKFIYQCPEVFVLEDILLNLIQCRSDEENPRPSFLTFGNKQQYVTEIMAITDGSVENWLRNSSNPTLQSKLQALDDFSGTIVTSSEPNHGYRELNIRYNYELKQSTVDYLYGNGPRDNLKRKYSFEKDVYYKFRNE